MFNIELEANNLIKSDDNYTYYEEEDAIAVIADICSFFDESQSITFKVSGFGDNNWKVDCGYDLLSVIVQLPDIIKTIYSSSYDFELDFYEQGTERTVFFKDYNETVKLTCISRTNWRPNDENITMLKEDVKTMFVKIMNDFLICAQATNPELVKDYRFKKWLSEIPII